MNRRDYTVGWICALPIETSAAIGMLDERHASLPQPSQDNNTYILGRIGVHNVAIACLPAGVMGETAAAWVAAQMRSTFPSLLFGLMVGIGGGVPSSEHDIRLGDVVVSKPDRISGGVVQYDFGKTVEEGRFVRIGSLNRPPDILLHAVSVLQAEPSSVKTAISAYISQMASRFPEQQTATAYPGADNDILFAADYNHIPDQNSCDHCDRTQLEARSERQDQAPVVHYGLIASGNQVMKDGASRERLRQELQVLCFEMEAAALMNHFPCLVVRGICDYSDSHKNKRWQPYAATTAAAYARKLLTVISRREAEQAGGAVETMSFAERCSPSKPIFSVPFRRDHRFIKRDEIFTEIEERLADVHCVSLHGLGGTGKSQVAIEYSYRFRLMHPESHVFWIYVSTMARVLQAYRDIARKLKLPGCDDPKVDAAKLLVNWLDEPEDVSWLMILDNADDFDLLFGPSKFGETVNELEDGEAKSKPLVDYLPTTFGPTKRMLVTTRNGDVATRLAQGEPYVGVSSFSLVEARELLQNKLGKYHDLSDSVTVNRLLEVLGYVPLAITQAAAFMNRSQVSVRHYLASLDEDEHQFMVQLSQELQDDRRTGTANSIYRTWKISFDKIRSQELQAAELLSLIAMFDGRQIPKVLLKSPNQTEVELNAVIGTLIGYSLISKEIDTEQLTIHPLVQASVRHWLTQRNEKVQYASQALRTVAKVLPRAWSSNKEIFEKMQPHIDLVLGYKLRDETKTRTSLLYKVARFHSNTGQYRLAEQLARQSYQERHEVFGETAAATFESLELVGTALRHQGKYDSAEDLNRQALAGLEKILGFDHVRTLNCAERLARVLKHQGKYPEAEALCRRALEAAERVKGQNHPDIHDYLHTLASVVCDQGRHEEAEQILTAAVEASRNKTGAESHQTLTCLASLGVTYAYQERYEKAEELQLQILQSFSKNSGPRHPNTAAAMANLALTSRHLGKYREAYDLMKKVLQLRLELLGSEHPRTVDAARWVKELKREVQRQEQNSHQEPRMDENQERFDDDPEILDHDGNQDRMQSEA